jgi:septum formation protein
LILASASPRRHELLKQLGVHFRVEISEADESGIPGESPADYVCRVARSKAEAVARRETSSLPVLGADTAVIIAGQILGKPRTSLEAEDMLRLLSGQVHEVYSAVVLIDSQRSVSSRLNITAVRFAPLDEAWIEAYAASGEPMDKAGAYGVQGCAAHRISEIRGSYSGVMGLPLFETMELLHAAGFSLAPCRQSHPNGIA